MTNATKVRAKAAREARLKAALRENLKRRKAQARGRSEGEADQPQAERAEAAARSDQDKP
jgi:hypothetical protein